MERTVWLMASVDNISVIADGSVDNISVIGDGFVDNISVIVDGSVDNIFPGDLILTRYHFSARKTGECAKIAFSRCIRNVGHILPSRKVVPN